MIPPGNSEHGANSSSQIPGEENASTSNNEREGCLANVSSESGSSTDQVKVPIEVEKLQKKVDTATLIENQSASLEGPSFIVGISLPKEGDAEEHSSPTLVPLAPKSFTAGESY